MKASKPHHVRSFLTFAAFLISSSIIVACATDADSKKAASAAEVPDEVSLKADRSEFSELRKDVPEDVRRDNDELASILQMMNQGSSDEEPSRVRERFNKALRSKRDRMDKIMRQRRDEFSKAERKGREDFLAKSKDEREDYARSKHSTDERKRFFDKQDDARKNYFDAASDKRKEFEAKITEERKAFEDYSREKTNQFGDLHRAYSATYYERKKNLDLKKSMDSKAKDLEKRSGQRGSAASPQTSQQSPSQSQSADPLDEWRSIPKTPGTTIGPGNQ